MNFIRSVGAKTLGLIQSFGSITLFLLNILAKSGTAFARPRLSVRQVYFGLRAVGADCCRFGAVRRYGFGFAGLYAVVEIQIRRYFGLYGRGFSVARISPVLAAILFASSAGGAMTSEIGLMKTTGQLEAMNVMAVNPVARVVAPRFWAGVFSMPLLASIFNVAGIFGAYLVGVSWLGLDSGIFLPQMQNNITIHYDVINGLIKSAAFGVAVTLIAVHQGFHCIPTSEGILRASTRTVVSSALTILAVDFILTAWMFTD